MFMERPAGCSWNGWPDAMECAPDVSGDALAASPVIRLDLAGGTKVSIAATAPTRLVLAVLRALR